MRVQPQNPAAGRLPVRLAPAVKFAEYDCEMTIKHAQPLVNRRRFHTFLKVTSFVTLGTLLPSAEGASFTEGHFYVPTIDGDIIEFDADLDEVARFSIQANIYGATGCVFNDQGNFVLLALVSNDPYIFEVDRAGAVLQDFTIDNSTLDQGSFLKFDAARGWYLFADDNHVTLVDRSFQLVRSSADVLNRTSGVAFGIEGSILATDQFSDDLFTFDAHLTLLSEMDIEGFVHVGMDVAADGDLLFANYGEGTIRRFDFGSGQSTIVVDGFGFGRLSDVFELPSGDIIVMGYNTRLYRYNALGQLLDSSELITPHVQSVAYFWPGSVCHADIAPQPNGDGVVGLEDVLAVINAFGDPCDSCAEDVAPPGGDSQVTIADIIHVISRWGACS